MLLISSTYRIKKGVYMKIFVREMGSKKWEFAESVIAKAETELQSLLVESPSLINIEEIKEGALPLVFAFREFGLLGSGSTDVLAFSSQGDYADKEGDGLKALLETRFGKLKSRDLLKIVAKIKKFDFSKNS